MHRSWGGIIAGVLFVLPSMFILMALTWIYLVFGKVPLVDATHCDPKITAPLTGITATVVGVMRNLAVFFAWHVLWPAGFGGGFEWFSALAGMAAFIALFKYKAGIIPVILACGVSDLAYTFML